MQDIPLKNGASNAHQRFSAQIGSDFLDFEINYMQSGQWAMNIYKGEQPLAMCAMLEPNADVIAQYRLGIGKMVFTGELTTLDNLGVNNKLTWVPPND